MISTIRVAMTLYHQDRGQCNSGFCYSPLALVSCYVGFPLIMRVDKEVSGFLSRLRLN